MRGHSTNQSAGLILICRIDSLEVAMIWMEPSLKNHLKRSGNPALEISSSPITLQRSGRLPPPLDAAMMIVFTDPHDFENPWLAYSQESE